MSEFLPPITRRVLYALTAMTVSILLLLWSRTFGSVMLRLAIGATSQIVLLVVGVALGVWLGGELSKHRSP